MPQLSFVRQIVANARSKVTRAGWVKDDANVQAAVSNSISSMLAIDIPEILAELILRVEKLEKERP